MPRGILDLMMLNFSRDENCSMIASEATSSSGLIRAGSEALLSTTSTTRLPVTTPKERRLRGGGEHTLC